MKLLNKLIKNTPVASRKVLVLIKSNLAELYTMAMLFVALPAIVWSLAGIEWGLLTSFVLQAIVGVLYIRGKS